VRTSYGNKEHSPWANVRYRSVCVNVSKRIKSRELMRLPIIKVWEEQKELLQDSNKCSVFLCNPGEIYGQWIHIDEYVKLKELIRKYKSNLQEVTYQRDEDYMVYYQIQRPQIQKP